MKQYLLIACLIVSIGNAYAQLTQPHRFEKKFRLSDKDFTVIPLKEQGVALFRETDKYKDGKHSWQIILLDTALHQQVDTLLTIDRDAHFIGYEYVTDKLYLLFQEGDLSKRKFIMGVLNLPSKSLEILEIKSELDLKLTHFSTINGNIVFGGYISEEPTVIIYESSTASVKVVPGFLQRNTELLALSTNQNNTFNVVLSERISSDEKRITFRTFDSSGKLLLTEDILNKSPRLIQTAMCSELEREDLLMIGTWSERGSHKAYGLYATMINPFAEQPVTFTAFGEMNHYLDYLKPKRAQRIKSKTKNALENGKIYGYTNSITPYHIIEFDGGFLVLIENYAPPSSNSSSNYNYGYQNVNFPYMYGYNPYYYNNYQNARVYRPYTSNQNLMNEVELKPLSSSLLHFNTKGELISDYSIKIEDVKLSSIRQVTDVAYFNAKAYFLYKKKSTIICKKTDLQNDESTEINEPVKLSNTFDELRDEEESESGVRHWYQNSFFTWGYQTIRNIYNEGDKIREVFYINKLVVQ